MNIDTIVAYVHVCTITFYVLQVIDEVDKDGKTPLMWAALRVFKYVCTYSFVFGHFSCFMIYILILILVMVPL